MPLPPFGILIVTYLTCGGLLWIIAYLLAPIGYQISLSRGIGAVFLMTVFSFFSSAFLKPALGNWRLLIELLVAIAIVKVVLRLPLSRSFATVLIYWVVLVTAVYFLFTRPERAQRRSALDRQSTRAACRLHNGLLLSAFLRMDVLRAAISGMFSSLPEQKSSAPRTH